MKIKRDSFPLIGWDREEHTRSSDTGILEDVTEQMGPGLSPVEVFASVESVIPNFGVAAK